MTAARALTNSAFFASMCAAIFCAGSSYADEPARAPVISENWVCGSSIDVGPEIVAAFHPTYVYQAKDKTPTFIGGFLKDAERKHSVVFVQKSDGWGAFAVQGQADFSNAYVSPENGQAVLFSMINVEGPGQSYQVLSTQDGFKTVKCGELPAPKTRLDTLDFMSIRSLFLDSSGNGSLNGIVRFSDDRKPECFVSDSKDGGLNWSAPVKTDPCIDSVVEELVTFDEGAGPVQDLKSLAR